MGIPAGPWYIDDLLTFTVNTHDVATGAGTDADSVPSFRVYEDETGTAILTGSMAKLDDTNTVGFYSERITLSAANGFEVGKSYSIYVSATVDGVTATQSMNFKVIATPVAIGTGSGLTAIPWNAAWDAEVQSEVADALSAYDPPTKAELDAAVAPLATASALATVAGYLDTEISAILEDTGTTIPAQIAALNNPSAVQIADEVATRTLTANVKQVNDIAVSGAGTEADPWGP